MMMMLTMVVKWKWEYFSYGDAEALTDEIEEANEVVEEVLRIKELLLNYKDEVGVF